MTVRNTIREHRKQIIGWLSLLAGLSAGVSAFWMDFNQSDAISDAERRLDLIEMEISGLVRDSADCRVLTNRALDQLRRCGRGYNQLMKSCGESDGQH